jgi:hypothetical protein
METPQPYSNVLSSDDEEKVRYLQYECSYRANIHPGLTWGDLIKKDYNHFAYLMGNHVPAESATYRVLRSELREADHASCDASVRYHDTEFGKEKQRERYFALICNHKGRMAGKTWKEIFTTDYKYFLWSVGNTMGRETRTFNVFLSCLEAKDQLRVLSTPQGKLYVRSDKNVIKKSVP